MEAQEERVSGSGAAAMGAVEAETEAQRRLTAAQLIGLTALLDGRTQTFAAHAAGVCRHTIRNWQRDEPFRRALREGREALLRETTTMLHAQSGWAAELLRQIAEDKGSAGYVRVAAARALIDLTVRIAVADDQAVRLSEIEEELAEQKAAKERR